MPRKKQIVVVAPLLAGVQERITESAAAKIVPPAQHLRTALIRLCHACDHGQVRHDGLTVLRPEILHQLAVANGLSGSLGLIGKHGGNVAAKGIFQHAAIALVRHFNKGIGGIPSRQIGIIGPQRTVGSKPGHALGVIFLHGRFLVKHVSGVKLLGAAKYRNGVLVVISQRLACRIGVRGVVQELLIGLGMRREHLAASTARGPAAFIVQPAMHAARCCRANGVFVLRKIFGGQIVRLQLSRHAGGTEIGGLGNDVKRANAKALHFVQLRVGLLMAELGIPYPRINGRMLPLGGAERIR